MSSSDLADRCQRVIAATFDANILAAATAAGVQAPTLHRIVSGAVSSPRLDTIRTLADAFGLSVRWLVGDSTSDEEQRGSSRPLAEPLWLVREFYRRRQRDDRRWLASVEAGGEHRDNPEIQEIISAFSDFRLIPDGTGGILDQHASVAFGTPGTPTARDVAVFRQLGAVETEFIAMAVQRLRKMGVKLPQEKAPKNRK